MAPQIPHVELARSVGTRLGEGLRERGTIAPEPMRRTLDAVRAHCAAVRGHYVKLFAIATSALRRADNGDAFADAMREITGVPLRVLSGEEEAQASFRGAVTALGTPDGECVGVIDTGGGSTEYAIGSGTHAERSVSCEIGAVRLTEELPELAGHEGAVKPETINSARERARAALSTIHDFPPIAKLAVVGGSATTAAAVVRGKLTPFNQHVLTRDDLRRTLERLCAIDYDARRRVAGMKPQRADILPAGIIVIDSALEALDMDRVVATTADLLLGYLLLQRDAEPSRTARPLSRS